MPSNEPSSELIVLEPDDEETFQAARPSEPFLLSTSGADTASSPADLPEVGFMFKRLLVFGTRVFVCMILGCVHKGVSNQRYLQHMVDVRCRIFGTYRVAWHA